MTPPLVKLQLPVSSRVSVKKFEKATKDGLIEAGLLWHQRFLPDHFAPGAEIKYNYQERTGKSGKQKFSDPMPIVAENGYIIGWRDLDGGIKQVKHGPQYYTNRTGKYRHRFRKLGYQRMPAGTYYARYKSPKGWRTTHGEYGYTLRKWRKYGHKNPLQFSGSLRQAVMGGVRVSANPNQATVSMKGPPWMKGFLKFRGQKGSGPNMEAELLKVLPDQSTALVAKVLDKIDKAFKR